jgi:citrate/tricarballylate utilization protein
MSFYSVMPHATRVGLFMLAAAFAACALWFGLNRFGRSIMHRRPTFGDIKRAFADALSLRYLGGGGSSCTYPGEKPSSTRRVFHHLTFYGFLACFAATVVAAFYDNVLGWRAPYPIVSVPVTLGLLGGISLCAGSIGLLALATRRDELVASASQNELDIVFCFTLLLTAATGLLLLALRGSQAMPVLLVIHLSIVLGLFLTMPYGKFVHGFYRLAALVANAMETGE